MVKSEIEWIDTIIQVADDFDPNESSSYAIPAQILDWQGYDMERFYREVNKKRTEEQRNEFFQEYARDIIERIELGMPVKSDKSMGRLEYGKYS
tara:strand:- start:180 stop:461 length:282 start_codon:yes stop_codon:yes gene_type:complete